MSQVIARRCGTIAAAALTVLAVGVPAASANLPQVPVKTQPNPIREFGPAVTPDYFAWSQTSRTKPHHYNLFAQAIVAGAPSGPKTRVNVPFSEAFVGGISGNRLAYQQIVNGHSDIRYLNLLSHRRSNPPVGVNLLRWQYDPRITQGWLMFGRYTRFNANILLWNLSTGTRRVLFSTHRSRHGTFPFADTGQLNGDYATFYACQTRAKCHVYLYTISTKILIRIEHATGVLDYNPAVSSTGTLYWGRSGLQCGLAQIMQLPLGGTETSLQTFNSETDLDFLQTYNDGTHDQLFYTRLGCATNSEDIYRVTAP
jgi:hypothetical protein